MGLFFASTLCRKILLIDTIFCFLLGLLLFLSPHTAGDFLLQRSTDGVHMHLLRCVGGQILALAFLCRRSSSIHCAPDVRSACLVVRLLSGILCTFILAHIRAVEPSLMQPDLLNILLWSSFGCAILYFLLLFLSGWPVGDKLYTQHWLGNILYQIDTVASISIGLAWVIGPKWLLHRQVRFPLDSSHEFCGRLMGLFFICSQVMSTNALHWRKHSDRAMAAETRAILCLLILSAQIWSQIAYKEHWSGNHWVGISLFSTWTGIAIIYRLYLWVVGLDSARDTISANDSDANSSVTAMDNGNLLLLRGGQKRKAN